MKVGWIHIRTTIQSTFINYWLIAFLWFSVSCQDHVPEKIQKVASEIPEDIDYSLHVKPILSDRCFSCHGPDQNTREAELRLDTKEGAYAALSSNSNRYAIKAGNIWKSEVFHRIISEDSTFIMPPPNSNLALTAEEKAIIIRWINQGAEYKPHWAFTRPVKSEVPSVTNPNWPVNEIDFFVLNKLESQHLKPNQTADKTTLIRRLYFDLTGLPPSPQQMEEFIMNTSEDAYEKLVDELLASPEHAERLAMEWMDVARYADSHGYHADGLRHMWPWRDWVISSFAKNLSYDKFITWQIAGDLLPNATREQIIATGFHRNHPINSEAGIVEEEYRVENVLDRVNTTGKAFLALTMECARCHDHKFDPISQKEYYQFSAFFNNQDELGVISNDGNTGPMLKLIDPASQVQLDSIRSAIDRLLEDQESIATDVKDKNIRIAKPNLDQGLIAYHSLDHDGQKLVNLAAPPLHGKIVGEVETVNGIKKGAIRINGDYEFFVNDHIGMFETMEPFSMSLWLKPEKQDHYQEIFGNAGRKNSYWRGYEAYLDSLNRVSFRLIHALPHNLIHITTKNTIPLNNWSHLVFTYDGSSKADGMKIFINGQEVSVEVHYDNLYKSILPVNAKHEREDRGLRFGKAYRTNTGDDGVLNGAFDEIRCYNRQISSLEIALLYQEDRPNQRIALDLSDSVNHWLMKQNDFKELNRLLLALRKSELAMMDTITEVMVMKEMPTPRPTFVLDRGIYNARKDQVFANTPSAIMKFGDDYPKNRLGLAKWLVSKQNPLTARVTVNRYWQMFFGQGIVRSSDDFGNQGDLPTHPQLLDWLAVDFMESSWNLRRLIKLMVMSATYQQSSFANPQKREKDPENLYLARGPKHRLPAEMIRDNVLHAAGLLEKKVGGPSVKPFQPKGLWREKGSYSRKLLHYRQDSGSALYRRSMYTFIRRTSPPPNMVTFDLQSRSYCVVKRQTTNTPLQALVLMNDPQFIEASRMIAERIQKEADSSLTKKLDYGFQLLTSRKLKPEEKEVFNKLYQEEISKFSNDELAADSILSIGDYPIDNTLSKVKTAALTVVASLMINHDESYMKR